MPMFLGKKSAQSTKPVIRTVTVTERKSVTVHQHHNKSKPQSQSSTAPSATRPRLPQHPRAGDKRKQPDGGVGSRVVKRERNVRRRETPPASRDIPGRLFESDDDDEEEDIDHLEDTLSGRKTRVIGTERKIDLHRRVRRVDTEPDEYDNLIHAADIVSLGQGCDVALGAGEDEVALKLQYPGSLQRERYELVQHKDKLDPVADIIGVVTRVMETFIPESEKAPFDEIVKRLQRAANSVISDVKAFRAAIEDYNSRLLALVKDGTVVELLDRRHHVPDTLVERILNQTYERVITDPNALKKYENGTDEVYGELGAVFSTRLLVENLQMTCDQVFVDLGSGVGNVCLQAALEIGCESHGCEIMTAPCALADKQLSEFKARCQLWGLSHGAVHLESGDFRINEPIRQVLKRADVVLVNNKVFTPRLNADLVSMFLDLKSGCRVVSLKGFVHKSTAYSENDVASAIFDVQQFTYPQGSVSWTDAAGTYYISTKK